jgi:hypothetical protein
VSNETLRSIILRARARFAREAEDAYQLFKSWIDIPLSAVPGVATVDRLAVRLDTGKTIEEAASAEYLYRWRLALQSRVFGVPHTIGM